MANTNLVQNIVGGWNKSDTRLANMSETMNMFVETQGTGSSTTSMLRSITGSSILCDVSDRPCRGLFQASRGIDGFPLLFGVWGNTLYVIRNVDGEYIPFSIYNGLTNTNNPVSMCETGGEGSANPHLIVVDGANVIAVNTELNNEDMVYDVRNIQLPYRVRQDDEEHPTQRIVPTHCLYVYNFLVVNDSGNDAIYYSYQYPFEREGKDHTPVDYDIFMVNPFRPEEETYRDYGNFTYIDRSPDNVTSICSNGTYIYAFGPKSSEVLTYNNSPYEPFVSPSNSANGIGIKAEHSLAVNGNFVFFLGSSNIGENGIFKYEANVITKISTPDIERFISTLDSPSDAIGQCWTENGHMFYSLSFINGDYTLVYDIAENLWHRRSSKDKSLDINHYWRLFFATLHENKLMFGTSDGKLVYLDDKTYTEYDDRPMIRMRRSGMLMNNYQDFLVDGIKLICNQGDYLVRDNELNPKIMMRYSENGGQWSNPEMALIGKQGQYLWETSWFNLGLHNVMSIEIICSDNINFNILNGKIQYCLVDSF